MLSMETLKQIRLISSITRSKSFKKIVSIPLTLILVITLIGVGYLAPISVFALSAGGVKTTIASIILSLLLQSGAGVTNQNWLNTLNASYGAESTIGTIEDCITNGLLTEVEGTLVDSGLSSAIESANAWSDLGLSDIFATTADDVGVAVATGGANLANTAINVGTIGTIGAFAGAAGIGVGIGVLANHIYEKWKTNVEVGAMITETQNVLNNVPPGGQISKLTRVYDTNPSNVWGDILIYPQNCFGYLLSDSKLYGVINTGNEVAVIKKSSYTIPPGVGNFQNINVPANSGYNTSYNYFHITDQSNFITFETQNALNDYIDDIRNGNEELPKPFSPDLINKDGNLRYNDNSIGVGDQTDGSDMMPVPEDAYSEWVDQANDNTDNGETGKNQGQDFYDFIAPYLINNPNNPPEPDQPTVNDPSRPNIPDQPELPDKPDITQEELEEGLGLATSVDLKEVFPFCIPFDLLAILAVFRVTNREAPIISFTFPDGNQIVLDFSIFDGVAGLMRTLELIAFVIGLAIVTRRLIGAT